MIIYANGKDLLYDKSLVYTRNKKWYLSERNILAMFYVDNINDQEEKQ